MRAILASSVAFAQKAVQNFDDSTRSVGMNLARRFNAGIQVSIRPRRVATSESSVSRRYATLTSGPQIPALKGQAKFVPTLRVGGS